ncbi:hypothetical protein [Saccharomonospora azurea]
MTAQPLGRAPAALATTRPQVAPSPALRHTRVLVSHAFPLRR